MRELRDSLGNEIMLTDTIIYAVKHSTSVSLHYAFVYSIVWGKGCNPYSIKVLSYSMHYNYRKHEYEPRVYKTTLTKNNFLKVSIPQDIQHKLMAAL